MKRKLFTFFATFLFLLLLPTTATADEIPLVIDNAGLMTEEQNNDLAAKALALRSEFVMHIVILTVDSLDGATPQDYADDYCDYNGLGYGDNFSGILFLLSMEERDWYISTYGDAIYALTDYGIQASAEEALPYFGVDDYYTGFYAWLDVLPAYLQSYLSNSPIDGDADYSGDFYHGEQEEIYKAKYSYEESEPSLLLSIVVGLAVATVTVLIMRFSMNSKRPQAGANDYLKVGSYHLHTSRDIFLYSNVKKTPKAPPPSSNSGGGSSVHRSSSGRTHGGGGGKF